MKKLLALVLALVMTLSLCTVTNAAYPDAADIDFDEAVGVMSMVGVFKGDEKGNFNPDATLTRETAAKLIAYLNLGEKVAEALPAVKVFSDVEANRWSAKYIAYCADAGYIAGVGDGSYNPTGELNGYAFAKLLLCVLGYDAEVEGYTGASWSINVAKAANKIGLFEGVDKAASAVLSREEAAQLCLNALQADCVEYDNKGTQISINGATIATGASAAKAVENKATTETIANDDVMQLAEKLYKDPALKLNTGLTDSFGRKLNTWTYASEKVEALAGDADYTFTGVVKGSELLSTLGLKSTDKLTITGSTFKKDASGAVTKSTDDVFNSENAVVEVNEVVVDGVVTEYNFLVVNYMLGYVKEVKPAKGDKEAYVTIYSGCDTDAGSSQGTFETTAFEKGDVVLYTKTTEIESVQLAESVDGKVTAVSGTTATIGGTKYGFVSGMVAIKDEGTFYLGIDGVIMDKVAKSTSSDDYAYVYNIVEDTATVDKDGIAVTPAKTAYYVDANGVAGKAVLKDSSLAKGMVYNYTINSDGKFEALGAGIAKSGSAIEINKDTKTAGGKYLSDSTKFVFVSMKDADAKDKLVVSTATGYKNVTINEELFLVVDDSDKVATVFVANLEAGVESDKTYGFLLDADAAESLDANDKTVYEFKVLLDGEETTLTASSKTIFSAVAENGYFSYTLKDGKLATVTKEDPKATGKKVMALVDNYVDIEDEAKPLEFAKDYVVYNNTDSDNLFVTDTLEKNDTVTYYTKTVDSKTVVSIVIITTEAP